MTRTTLTRAQAETHYPEWSDEDRQMAREHFDFLEAEYPGLTYEVPVKTLPYVALFHDGRMVGQARAGMLNLFSPPNRGDYYIAEGGDYRRDLSRHVEHGRSTTVPEEKVGETCPVCFLVQALAGHDCW